MLVLLTISIAGCGKSDSANVASERSSEGNKTVNELGLIELNQDRIKKLMKDPDATKFQNSRVYYAIAPIVCGEVNSANGLGGKTGFQRFISGGTIQVVEEQMEVGEMDKLWPQVCK